MFSLWSWNYEIKTTHCTVAVQSCNSRLNTDKGLFISRSRSVVQYQDFLQGKKEYFLLGNKVITQCTEKNFFSRWTRKEQKWAKMRVKAGFRQRINIRSSDIRRSIKISIISTFYEGNSQQKVLIINSLLCLPMWTYSYVHAFVKTSLKQYCNIFPLMRQLSQ